MHQKFLSQSIPMIAEGDFVGVFLETKGESLISIVSRLVEEGIEREEKILLDASLDLSHEIFKHESVFRITPFTDGLEGRLKEYKESATIEEYSGIRYIGLSKSFFSDESSSLPETLSGLLSCLMNGGISISILYQDSATVSFSQLTRHPRIYYKGRVMTNSLFLLPEQVGERGGELDAYLENCFHKSSTNDFKSGETFPRGIPNMLESIIESMGVGVVVGDSYGNMVLINKAAQTIVGLPPSPLPYPERIRRFGNFLPDEVTPFPFDELPLSRAINGEQFENELIFLKNSRLDKGKFVTTSGRGVRNSRGDIVGGVIVFRDITEEHTTQKEKEELELTLLQAQKMESLGMLAGGIAHDFNNLLVGVLGNASILIQQGLVLEEGQVRLEQIENSALQLTDLTRQLLMYAGLSPCKSMNTIHVISALNSMKGIVDTGISKKVSLEWSLSDENLYINADEVQIRQIVLNLITNASDAHQGKVGTINVRAYKKEVSKEVFKKALFSACEQSGDYVIIEVEDTGGGVSEEVIDKIFDPFFSTKGMGRGLGLSAVVGIVKNHKGALELHTESGVGSRFRIYFPAQKGNAHTVSEENEMHEEPMLVSGTILVIDDEPMVIEVAETILSSAGFEVLSAKSGGEGLRYYAQYAEKIVGVLIDMTMPDISGVDVYAKIREKSGGVPILISSGFSKELCKDLHDDDPYCRFLAKPYPAPVLLKVMQELIETRSC
jgi:signal transduction histidine kinase/CheY-like chemotaxis protein